MWGLDFDLYFLTYQWLWGSFWFLLDICILSLEKCSVSDPFSFFLAVPCDLWDFRSLTRDWTKPHQWKNQSPSHWFLARESPPFFILNWIITVFTITLLELFINTIFVSLIRYCGCSVAKSYPTLCKPEGYSMPGCSVLHDHLDFAQNHVLWVRDSIQPSHPVLPPLLLLSSIFPSIRVFSNESALCIRWPKYWSFSFSISPPSSGLISFRIDWFDLLAVQGTLKSLLQHHSWKASILQCSAFFMVQLSHPYMTTGKTIALTRWTFVGKVISLLFNTLSLLWLSSKEHLLISWLQSPSAVILEPKKIKCVPASTFPPSICHEVVGLDAMILVFWMLRFRPAFFALLFHPHQEALCSSSLPAIRVV